MIELLKLHHFRGLEETTLHLGPSVNMWLGENGAGKTSVLESVALLSFGRSFVTSRNKSLIAFDQPELTVFSKVLRGTESHRMAVQITRGGERRLRFDGAAARGQATLSRALPVLTIAPHIADLIVGTPGDRRRFMDWGAFHCTNGEAHVFAGLKRALLQRNTGLRSGTLADQDLASWDCQIAALGEQVDCWRSAFVAQIQPAFTRMSAALGLKLSLAIRYHRGWGEGSLLSELELSRDRDRKLRLTQLGPQRADIEFLCGKEKASEVLSRGQLKTANVALVLAQLEVARCAGVEPVLCLDDPGAELDARFQASMWQQVLRSGCQVLATGIDEQRVGLSIDGSVDPRVFHVKHGLISVHKEG